MTFEKRRTGRFYIFQILLIYVLIVICLAMPITVSRYISHGEGGDDAQAAVFEITQEGSLTKTLELTMGSDNVWSFEEDIRIVNGSETDIWVTVQVETVTQNLPVTFIWDDDRVDPILLQSGGELSRTLEIAWDDAIAKDYTYSGEIDRISVTVICEQRD